MSRRRKQDPKNARGQGAAPIELPYASMSDASPMPWRAIAILSLILVAATVTAFSPTFKAGFISWDDPDYLWLNPMTPTGVTEQPTSLLKDVNGLMSIWDPRPDSYDPTGRPKYPYQQWYPMVFTSYWLEHQMWGINATGYHVTNVVLHCLNTVLVLILLYQFGATLWMAAVAAAIFALNPVQVSSVAWVAERKNTLAMVFYLIAFLLYFRFRQRNSWQAYWGCMAAFLVAMLSKTQVLTFPLSALIAHLAWEKLRRVPRVDWLRKLAPLAPMLALGLVFAPVTKHIEHSKGSSGTRPSIEERLVIVPSAAWFYAGKFLAPADLAPIYPQWKEPLKSWPMWAGLAAWPVAIALAIRFRRKIPPLLAWGALHFFIVLLPILGIVEFNYQQYACVADHYLYFSCIGGGLVLAFVLGRLSERGAGVRSAVTVAAAILLAGYGTLTYAECRHWKDTETFWTRTIERNPESFPAHLNLANYYTRGGIHPDKTFDLYRRASEIEPTHAQSFTNYMARLRMKSGPEAVAAECRTRLKIAVQRERAGLAGDAAKMYKMVAAVSPQGSPERVEADAGVSRMAQSGHILLPREFR